MSRVLIVGCGYVGSRLAGLLAETGAQVWGLKRDPTGLPAGVTPVAGDVTDRASLRDLPAEPDALVYAVSPAERTEAAYRAAYVDGLRNVLDAVGGGGWVILVSSTGVYGQSDGRWVDEDSPEEPADATARTILEGEALARTRGRPGVVLRLGGIYGPGRSRTVRRVLAGDAPCVAPDVYGNRVHREDAAGALLHLLTLPDPFPVYLGVDRDPAPLRAVYAWIAERCGMSDPCVGTGPDEVVDEGARGTNKRCSSRRLVDAGYRFRYPSYRDGYAPLIEALTE